MMSFSKLELRAWINNLFLAFNERPHVLKADGGWNGWRIRGECFRAHATWQLVCSPIQWCGVIYESSLWAVLIMHCVWLRVCVCGLASPPPSTLSLWLQTRYWCELSKCQTDTTDRDWEGLAGQDCTQALQLLHTTCAPCNRTLLICIIIMVYF